MTVFDFVNSRAIAQYWETLESNRIPLLGDALFPSRKKMGLDLSWIKGYDELPVALAPSAFDTKPIVRDRGGIAQEETQMPFFRESMTIKEKDRQDLLIFMENNGSNPMAQAIIQRLYDDRANLIEGARIIPEIMRMKLLTEGSFTIAAAQDQGRDTNYTYDYDPNGEWAAQNKTTLLGTSSWADHENSDPIADIEAVKRNAAARGITLDRMIIGHGTWTDLLQNSKIKLGITPLASAAANVVTTDQMVRNFLQNTLQLNIIVYSKMYKDTSKNAQYFYPVQGTATFLPAGDCGSTWYGTTPEEADLMSGRTDADVSIVNTGIAVCTKKESLPVNIVTWAAEIVLPSYENMDRTFVIDYSV